MTPGAYVLLASLTANAALGWAWLDQRDAATAATEQRDSARGLASACSDATEALRELADKRKGEANTARTAAAKAALTHDQRADATLSRHPKDPTNTCASMQALGDEWLQGRVKP